MAWVVAETRVGRLPHLRIGRRTLYSLEAVKEVLAQRAAQMPEPLGKEACHDRD